MSLFNLLISYSQDSWDGNPYELEKDRVVTEYTASEIVERYRNLDESKIQELKSFPCIFAIENETAPAKVGYITEIRLRTKSIVIEYEFDPFIQTLPMASLETMRTDIDLGKWELSRTHWAIKDERLYEILVRRGYATKEQVDAAINRRTPLVPASGNVSKTNPRQVFIVHGQDDLARVQMSTFISSLGLQPIVLHEQASNGMTIIEKIEYYSNVGFGIILYTPCDIGCRNGEMNSRYRARQNVVFEHGYLIAKLGRSRVTAMVKGPVEIPNDISGVVYVGMDDLGAWQNQLKTELRSAGYSV